MMCILSFYVTRGLLLSSLNTTINNNTHTHTHKQTVAYTGGDVAGLLAIAAAALSAGLGSCSHLTCVAGPYLMCIKQYITLLKHTTILKTEKVYI